MSESPRQPVTDDKAALESLQAELAERELELATLIAELRAFEVRYDLSVGRRQAELDKVRAQIEEIKLRGRPANEQRNRTSQNVEDDGWIRSGNGQPFVPSPALKKLYRAAARRFHPDLADDEAERERRMLLMSQVNRAYQEGDEAALLRLLETEQIQLDGREGKPESAVTSDASEEIARLRRAIKAKADEITLLRDSALYRLKLAVEDAEDHGRNLLADMATSLILALEDAREELQKLRVGTNA
jgi:hypothetical protein